jgi:hypothetical protein
MLPAYGRPSRASIPEAQTHQDSRPGPACENDQNLPATLGRWTSQEVDLEIELSLFEKGIVSLRARFMTEIPAWSSLHLSPFNRCGLLSALKGLSWKPPSSSPPPAPLLPLTLVSSCTPPPFKWFCLSLVSLQMSHWSFISVHEWWVGPVFWIHRQGRKGKLGWNICVSYLCCITNNPNTQRAQHYLLASI